MEFKSLNVSLIASGAIFILTAIMGLTSGVGITMILFRSVLSAMVLGLLVYGFTFYLKNSIIPLFHDSEEDIEEKTTGNLVDLSVGDEEDLTTLLQKDAQEDIPAEKNEFIPFAPQQIDPNLKEMIENNPKQAAEVVRKMGLDQ